MTQRPPNLSLPSRLLGRTAERVARLPRALARVLALSVCAGTLLLDYLAGAHYNVGIPYLLCLALVAWCLAERSAMLAGVAFGALSALVQHHQVIVHSTARGWLGLPWINGALRVLWTYLLVTIFAAVRGAIELERWRAQTDALTGVLNKAAFEDRMGRKISDAQAADGALVLAYMDLDGFKAVNDRHGHSAGDRVLRAFAAAAREAIRGDDLFARIGGDEFAALLVVPSLVEGDRVAAMVHDRLSTILAETGLGVTCSTGALVMEARQVEPADSYVELADKLMYEVKQAGKNALRIGRVDPVGAVLRSAFPPAEPQFDLPVPPSPHLVARRDAA